jgi:hypothetical protein
LVKNHLADRLLGRATFCPTDLCLTNTWLTKCLNDTAMSLSVGQMYVSQGFFDQKSWSQLLLSRSLIELVVTECLARKR